jgi:FkbH-like protein
MAVVQLLIVVFDLFLLPTFSAMILAAGLGFSGIAERIGVLGLISLVPFLYLAWLLIYLFLCRLEMSFVFRRFPKLSRIEGKKDDLPTLIKLRGVQLCYVRLTQLLTLPFVRSILMYDSPIQRWVLRAYAPSVHMGRNVQISGTLYDPDLTELADDVTLGGFCALSAHSMNISPDGSVVYISAPIKIGPRATVGGESRIAMGVVIGEEGVVEPGSVVPPFTQIGPREVWGGNPATLRRRKDDSNASPLPIVATLSDNAGVSVDDVRGAVAAALQLPLETVTADFHAGQASQWDSLGQLTIAASLYDRLGIRLDPDVIFRLKSVPQILASLAGVIGPASATSDLALPTNPELLPLFDHEEATRLLATHYQGQSWPADVQEVRLVVAATFTARAMSTAVELWCRPFGLRATTEFFDFNQIEQALLLPTSSFRQKGTNLVLIRTEDLPLIRESEARAKIESMLSAIESFVAQTQGTSRLLVGTLPPVLEELSPEQRRFVDDLRTHWAKSLSKIDGVEVFDFSRIIDTIGVRDAMASKFDTIARAGYSLRVMQELGIQTARLLRARVRPPAKVLALDADNTLWGGVVAEDGLDGIKISSDGPERSFQLFQQWAVEQKNRGVLLVIVSRNEEGDVWEVFDKHPGMILRRSDIAGWRINWKPKSENLRDLASELNLGIDSFVFADDDTAVRAEVSARLPQVTVLPMPAEPAGYRDLVSKLWVFDGAQATAEDRQRTDMIQQERDRKELQQSAGNLDDYLRSLEVIVEMKRANEADLPRVAQLTQKTNQFNLSLHRRTLEEVREFWLRDSVYTLRAKDRFGDYGLIGVAMIRDNPAAGEPAKLDTLLLSCRALGRGIEEAFLHGIIEHARNRNASVLSAPFVIGPRNEPARDFMTRAGFPIEEGETPAYILSTDESRPCPEYLTFRMENPVAGPH